MRLGSLRFRGIGPFVDEVEIDLDALPGPLVAVTGDNGSGKSTLLEMLPGALYRQCPTRGSLTSLAVERHAFVEASIVYGTPYTIRQLVDGVSGKGESIVLDAKGDPLLDDTKLRTFDRWAAEHLPSSEVLYASMFAVQGSGGFLDSKPAERKATLLRALGIERLEVYAADARERARGAKTELDVVLARLEDVGRDAGDVEELGGVLDRIKRIEVELVNAVEAVRQQLDAARERAAEAARSALQLDGHRRQEAALGQRKADRTEERLLVVARIEEARALLETEDALRAGATAWEAHDAAAVATEKCLSEIRARYEEVRREQDRRSTAVEAAATASRRATTAAERIEQRLAGRTEVEAAAAQVDETRTRLTDLEAARDTKDAERDAARDLRLHGVERRIDGLRIGLAATSAATDIGEAVGFANSALVADDSLAEQQARAPVEWERLLREIDGLAGKLRTLRHELGEQERLAARAGDIAAAAAEQEEAIAESERCADRELGATLELDVANGLLAAIRAEGVSARTEFEALKTSAPDDVRGQLAALERSRVQIEELEPRAAKIDADLAAIDQERATLGEAPTVDARARTDVRDNEEALRETATDLQTMRTEAAVVEQRLERARAVAVRVAELEEDRARLDEDLRVWTRLASDLGRDGLQALEIDAAGPELTEAINDLLHTCVSTRWTVSIETTHPDSRGKRQIEGLDVQVLDTKAGRLAPVETYSGGECVLIGEAVSLALTMLACRRSGIEGVTLVRDESGAALAPAKARAWVAMLRRAARIVGASRVLLVSHSPEVAELCDSRIVVKDGRIEVGT